MEQKHVVSKPVGNQQGGTNSREPESNFSPEDNKDVDLPHRLFPASASPIALCRESDQQPRRSPTDQIARPRLVG